MSTTLDLYAHVMPSTGRAGADALAALVGLIVDSLKSRGQVAAALLLPADDLRVPHRNTYQRPSLGAHRQRR